MLRKSDWMMDKRPLYIGTFPAKDSRSWQEWVETHFKAKEHWFMDIVDFLLKNQDFAGGYLLVRTYIATVKLAEKNKWYNKSPWDETPHVRALRLWFWDMCERHNFAVKEDDYVEFEYEEEDSELVRRRRIERSIAASYPFVGGKARKQYSEAVEFFKSVAADRAAPVRRKGSLDTKGKTARGPVKRRPAARKELPPDTV